MFLCIIPTSWWWSQTSSTNAAGINDTDMSADIIQSPRDTFLLICSQLTLW